MKILYLFLFFFIFNFISCDDVKETLEEYEGDNYEEELLKYKVNVYVENNFKNRK